VNALEPLLRQVRVPGFPTPPIPRQNPLVPDHPWFEAEVLPAFPNQITALLHWSSCRMQYKL